MSKQNDTTSISIDNQILQVPKGLTILQAAEENKIYIPTLCAHKDLTPFGGCRMCIVEVEGMRGLPTACTTPVEEGMIVRTQTAQVQAERLEILQLILSEHTSSCLICEEKEECKQFMGTIRKAGVTTGCRYCPNDGQCELQDVVERLGVKEIGYPVYYRGLRIEKEDPFYDRDYNLCILCGRCIRMCQEIRTANTLAFKQRGRYTVIGPAYHRTHLEAGCEFCGACVSVCPTGALSEKARKWEGKEEKEVVTTCSLCGVGCQIRLLVKGDRVMGSLPDDDPWVNNGQLCVKGRFCITELVGNYQRLRRPYKTQNNTKVEISWDEAIELAVEKLSACSPEDFGMLISANCCNEDLYVAQKFVRTALRSNHIDTTARVFYGSGFNAYLNLMKRSVPLSDLQKASVILCIGLDTRFGRSVVGVELRKAIKRGAKIVTIHPRNHNLTLISEKWLQPAFGEETQLLQSLVELIEKKKAEQSQVKARGEADKLNEELSIVAKMLKEASDPVILVGSEFLQCDESPEILGSIERLAKNIGAGVLPLPAQNNLFGSILTGVYPEFLPGGRSIDTVTIDVLRNKRVPDLSDFSTLWNAEMLASGKKLKVLYLIGEIPSNFRELAEFVIFQNIYPPDPWHAADLVLPSAAFTEADGTFLNGEGRMQKMRKAVDPPGEALPDWEILCRIAQKMGKEGFDFPSVSEVHSEMFRECWVKAFGDFGIKREAGALRCEEEFNVSPAKPSKTKRQDRKFPFLLTTSVVEHTYRGFLLSTWVEGARVLFTEGIVDINPEDAQQAEVSEGDQIVVQSESFERIWPIRITSNQPIGTLDVTLRLGESIRPNPHPARIRKKDV